MSYTTSEWSTGNHQRQPTAPDLGPSYASETVADQASESSALGWISIRNAAIGRLRKLSHGHSTVAIEPPRGRVPGLAHQLRIDQGHQGPTRPVVAQQLAERQRRTARMLVADRTVQRARDRALRGPGGALLIRGQ